MMRGLVVLVALAGCREIYGLDDPELVPLDAFVVTSPGLHEHILPDTAFWTMHDTPEGSWAATATTVGLSATNTVWTGQGPSVVELETAHVNVGVQFSVWFDGQIYATTDLDLSLIADDFAFVDLSTDGTTYTRLLESDNKAVTRTLAGFDERWYSIRIGWSQTGGAESFLFQQKAPDATQYAAWDISKLRFAPAM